MTDSAGFSQNAKRRNSIFDEEEEIAIKPSVDLTSDEYEIKNSQSLHVHIFYCNPNFEELSTSLQNVLSQDSISRKTLVESINDFDTTFEQALDDSQHYSGLVFVFFSILQKEGSISFPNDENYEFKNIWSQLSASKRPEFRDKPKVFLFLSLAASGKTAFDGRLLKVPISRNPFDSPDDSDLLIVYKKFDRGVVLRDFVETFSNIISMQKKKFDFIDLLNLSKVHNDRHTVFISTLTRKFYLSQSAQREHYLAIYESNSKLDESMLQIFDFIEKLQVKKEQKDKKKIGGFLASFRRRPEEKAKVEQRPPRPLSPEPVSPPRTPARARQPNVSESDSINVPVKKTSVSKPPWKY